MKRVVAIFTANESLSEIAREIHAEGERVKERIKFLEKQAHDANAAYTKANEPRWEKLTTVLKERGLLGDYDPKKDTIGFSLEENMIFVDKGGRGEERGGSLAAAIKGLFT